MPHQAIIIDGIPCPSVTDVTSLLSKPFLERWRGAKGNRYCDAKLHASAGIGSRVHAMIAKDEPPTKRPNSREEDMYRSWFQWAEKLKLIIASAEQLVKCKEFMYGGTLDAVGLCSLTPGLTIFDWKTSSQINHEQVLQLAAYAYAYKEQTGVEIKQGMIVNISKERPHFKVTHRVFDLHQEYMECFLGLLLNYNTFRKRKRAEC